MTMEEIKAVSGGAAAGEKYRLPGGATRSEQAPAYHLVPRAGHRRTAQRFAFGAAKHGARNWESSVVKESDAAAFCNEAFNHLIEHALKMASGIEPEDDHLGAIGWAQSVLCHVEEKFGKRWTELKAERG